MPGYEFVIHQKSVSCTSCDKVFATPVNRAVPDMIKTLPVETDLHRLLPYGALRGSMMAICPFCQYAWWASTFSGHFTLPVGISEAPKINEASKFAHAIFTGRKNNYHILDRAMLALNGYWCAQECHEKTSTWLALAIQELRAALAEQNWTGNRSRYHYILAELLRRQGDFAAARREYDLVDESANLPDDLCAKQKQLASEQKSHRILLNSKQIEQIFFPDLVGDIPPEIFAPLVIEQEEMIRGDEVLREMIKEATSPAAQLPIQSLPSVPAKKIRNAADSAWQDVRITNSAGR